MTPDTTILVDSAKAASEEKARQDAEARIRELEALLAARRKG